MQDAIGPKRGDEAKVGWFCLALAATSARSWIPTVTRFPVERIPPSLSFASTTRYGLRLLEIFKNFEYCQSAQLIDDKVKASISALTYSVSPSRGNLFHVCTHYIGEKNMQCFELPYHVMYIHGSLKRFQRPKGRHTHGIRFVPNI